eukprot:3788526-Pleurochrysis_carterae.AAC.1
MVDADGLIQSSMVLAALKEAMDPDVGHLCALLGEDRNDDDEYMDPDVGDWEVPISNRLDLLSRESGAKR